MWKHTPAGRSVFTQFRVFQISTSVDITACVVSIRIKCFTNVLQMLNNLNKHLAIIDSDVDASKILPAISMRVSYHPINVMLV